jgi:hypothetical protein
LLNVRLYEPYRLSVLLAEMSDTEVARKLRSHAGTLFSCLGALPDSDLVAEMSDREVARKLRSHAETLFSCLGAISGSDLVAEISDRQLLRWIYLSSTEFHHVLQVRLEPRQIPPKLL